MFTVSTRVIQTAPRFDNMLKALGPKKSAQAINRAVNRAGDMTRTAMRGALVKQTGLKSRTVGKALKTTRSNYQRLAYVMKVRGGDIRLKHFSARETRKGVSANPFGARKKFAGTFMKGGRFPARKELGFGGQVLRRTDSGRLPIEVVRSVNESYGYDELTYRRRATPAEISRMTETWGWINDHPIESERVLLYAWAWTKAKRGRSIADFAAREGIKSRTLRYAITAICQAIADRLNRHLLPPLDDPVDVVAEEAAKTASHSVSSPRHVRSPESWIESDARPVIFPADSPEMVALQKRLDKANKRRRKSRKSIRA